MSTEHGRDDESLDAQTTVGEESAGGDGARPRRGRRRRDRRGAAWAFFHPPEASWAAPGEEQARTVGQRLQSRLERSAGLRAAVAAAAVLVMVLVVALGWALSRPGEQAAGPSSEAAGGQESSASSEPDQLPGGQGDSGDDREAPESAGAEAEPERSGQEADDEALERINDGGGLITARAEDGDDPLVTGARFLRSLRSTDTTSDDVADWYAARDSFLAEGQAGRQTDWGEAGEKDAVSEAEISWAERDAAIEDGRGIAPEFPYGPEAEPGTHLVQVGMRLDRQITAGEETVDTPSGALMEAVVVCPPAEGVDRCVVTRWAEEPAGFTASVDESWEVYP